MKTQHLTGIFFSLLTFLLFSLGDAARKQLSLQGYSPFFIMFCSGFFISIALLVLCLARGRVKQDLSVKMPLYTGLRCLVFFALAFFAILSFKYLAMTDAYILILTAPLIGIIVFRLFYAEPIRVYKILALLFGLIGAVLVVRPGFGAWSHAYFAAIAVAICFVTSNLLLKKVVSQESKISIIFYPNLAAALVSAAVLLHLGLPDMGGIAAAMVVIAASSSLCAAYTMAVAIEMIEASEVGLYHYVQVFFGMVLGYVAFAEIPDIYAILGAVFIFISGVVIYVGSKRRQALEVLDPEVQL